MSDSTGEVDGREPRRRQPQRKEERIPPDAAVRDLLETLAWAEGDGVPSCLVPVLAAAVTGRALPDDDVSTQLTLAAGYLSEARSGGRAVYRISDGGLRRELRAATLQRGEDEVPAGGTSASAVHARITDALMAAGRDMDRWADPDPYLRQVLPRHAALGDRLERLCSEPGYLAAAQADALLAALPVDAPGVARTYRRVSHRLQGLDPQARALALDITAVAAGEERPPNTTGLKVRWRHGPVVNHRQDLPGEVRGLCAGAVAVGKIDGAPVIVTAGTDDMVRLWDARTGEVRRPALGHDHVGAVAIGVVDGQPVVVAGNNENKVNGFPRGTLRMWDARIGTTRGGPFGRGYVDAVAVGLIDGEPVIVTGGSTSGSSMGIYTCNGRVDVYDARTKERRLKTRSHGQRVKAVAIGVIDELPVIVSGAEDTVQPWDARTGKPMGQPLDPGEAVRRLAIGAVGDQPVVVSVGDETVRLWDARTGSPLCEPVSRRDWILALATGVLGGRRVAVSGEHIGLIDDPPLLVGQVPSYLLDGSSSALGGTVRLWDAGDIPAQPASDHYVTAVAGARIDGRPVVISGDSEGSVSVWDAETGRPRRQPLPHDEQVKAIAVGLIDGRPAIVSASGRIARLWDAATGTVRGQLLHDEPVSAVAIGVLDGEPIVVSGDCPSRALVGVIAFTITRKIDRGADGVVRLWDARTGERRVTARFRASRWGRGCSHKVGITALATGVIDGHPTIVSAGADGDLRLWDARTGTLREQLLRGHQGPIIRAIDLGVVHGQPTVVSGGVDGTVRLWDARTGTPRGSYHAHDTWVTSVAIAVFEDHPAVVSGGQTPGRDEGTVRLWNPFSTRVLPILSGVNSLAVLDGGLAVGTSPVPWAGPSSLLVVDVPGLRPSPAGS